MSTQNLDELLKEAHDVAIEINDSALEMDCARLAGPAREYDAVNYRSGDPLELLRDEWKKYAREINSSLNDVGKVFDKVMADFEAERRGLIEQYQKLDTQKITGAQAAAASNDSQAVVGRGNEFDRMKQRSASVVEQMKIFSETVQGSFLVQRVRSLDESIVKYINEFGNPRRSVAWALLVVRFVRALSISIRGSISATLYVGIFALAYFFDDRVKGFFEGLFAGQPRSYIALFVVMLLIEVIKEKLVKVTIEQPLRHWEAGATGREIEKLCVIGVRTRILIAKMNAKLVRAGASAQSPATP